MAQFFCIYSGKVFDEAERTLEHIVPFSIGGSNDFATRDVSRIGNSAAGHQADSGLVNSVFIAHERWQRGIASEQGHVPTIEFRGHVEVDGVPIKATFRINPDRTTDLKLAPTVSSEWSTRTFLVACDTNDLPRIVSDLERKGRTKGIDFRLLDHVVDQEAVDVPMPTMGTGFTFDTTSFAPAFIKMAIGAGHWVLGSQWSQSSDADHLRTVLKTPGTIDWHDAKIHGGVWPDVEDGRDFAAVFEVGADRHVLFVSNLNPVGFYALLFGKYDGSVQLAPGTWTGDGPATGDGHVVVLDSKTREVWHFGFAEFLEKKRAGDLPFPR